ncbi:MAG TPA: hypothetical protein VIL65_00620 [Beijerinckiaceae bacterium]|jgi:hypothetical protein
MPCLDAHALTSDPDGLAFLRDVLNQKAPRARRTLAMTSAADAVVRSEPMPTPMPRRRRPRSTEG